MKIGVLTSSRADYSIYYPLLKKLQEDSFFDLSVIAFGTHLSQAHGYTLQKIKEDNFTIAHEVRSYPDSDSPQSITASMGLTISEFSRVWKQNFFDLVFCLGDRYEMFAACASAVPFNIRLAHIHGGEQTLGAIDDVFRHSITHMSSVHFTASEKYRQRVVELKGSDEGVFNTGSLSIDNLKNLQLYSIEQFKEKFNIDLSVPTILITFHPETVSFEKNGMFADQLVEALREVRDYQLVITMPNADTMGNLVREKLKKFIETTVNAIGVESFGTLGYLSCMKHCSFVLGNTSSGFIEAAFFPKYVINLGDRQKGRILTQNIENCPIDKTAILTAIQKFNSKKLPPSIGIYGDGDASGKIINVIKSLL